MKDIWKKQLFLTGYLELLINHYFSAEALKNYQLTYGFDKTYPTVQIITPSDPTRRGSQLSLVFSIPLTLVQKELQKKGVVVSSLTFNCFVILIFSLSLSIYLSTWLSATFVLLMSWELLQFLSTIHFCMSTFL